jgi:hypothetical protein
MELMTARHPRSRGIRGDVDPKKRSRKADRSKATQKARTEALWENRFRCSACNWEPPALLRGVIAGGIAVHHVIPVACGGSDDPSNLLLLCANCHALAHAICTKSHYSSGTHKEYFGPLTAKDMCAELKLLLQSPESWQAQREQEALSYQRTAVDLIQMGFFSKMQ